MSSSNPELPFPMPSLPHPLPTFSNCAAGQSDWQGYKSCGSMKAQEYLAHMHEIIITYTHATLRDGNMKATLIGD